MRGELGDPHFVYRFQTDVEARKYNAHGGDLVVARLAPDGGLVIAAGPFASFERQKAEDKCRALNESAIPNLFEDLP